MSCVHTTQTSQGSSQVFENLGLAHASVDAKNLGSAQANLAQVLSRDRPRLSPDLHCVDGNLGRALFCLAIA